MTGITFRTVVLDCPDPEALAEFYRGVLGGQVRSGDPEWADLTVDGHRLGFQRAENYRPPSWPDGVPQQMHLDLTVASYDEPHMLVTGLGATPLDPVEPPPAGNERGWRVYADPAGHPFCLCTC